MGLSSGEWAAIAAVSILVPPLGIPFLLFGLGPTLQADAAHKAAEAQADAEKAKGRIELAEAKQNARQMRRNHSRILAAQRVAFGKGGLLLEGTTLDVLAENAGEYELDAVTRERYGKNALNLARSAAAGYKMEARYAAAGAGVQTLTNATSFAGSAFFGGFGGLAGAPAGAPAGAGV